uniref:DUF4220 domain-containing protein n=1 Tax=Oryza punctata TaxID=4537 RepID=A0A0E0MI70_ORYPU
MERYRYVVAREDKQNPRMQPPEHHLRYNDNDRVRLVTVERIWACNGSLLSGGSGGRLKDVCLSMALSKMLNRRFAGFQVLGESNLDKTRDFLFGGLLHGDSYVERAFRVIEVELAFVHDYFYTKYFLIYSSHHLFVMLSFAMVPTCGWLAYKLFQHFLRVPEEDELIFLIDANHMIYDALFTSVTAIAIALLEGLQVYIYLASAWCKNHGTVAWVANCIGCITSLKYFPSWEDKLGQYTLLKSFDYKPMNILYYATLLSMDVKRTVLETLKNRNGQLGNGAISLHANEVFDQLSWSCTTLPTTTHIIMAWHIATTLCEEEAQDPANQPSEEQPFAPELLPDHSFISESIFDALVHEAHELLGGKKTMQERKQALLSQDRGNERLLVVGGRLANNLIGIDHPWWRWKVLRDFWAEMMLYIAPSNDAKAHLETLPRGGEFITHLWAFLTHGGILERPTGPAQNLRLIRIEVLVFLGVVGLFVFLLLGSYRRRSSCEAVKMTIWVAYAASIPMVSYTLGLMQSSLYKNSLFSVWAVILFIFLGSADSFSAYSLLDNDNWKTFYLKQLIQSFWVGWLMGSSGGSDFQYTLWVIYSIVILKSGTRVASFKLASRHSRLSKSTKWVADYMSYEHLRPAGEEVQRNPVNMQGYGYVVAGEDKQNPEPPEYHIRYNNNDRARLVTVERIWACNGSLLSGGNGGRLKDVCLSMALSKMLNRRFAGFQVLAESNLDKTRDFLFGGLLHGDRYWDRAFRVIEVELAFVHDYFYTKYFLIYNSHHLFVMLSFAMVPTCGWLAYKLFQHFLRVPEEDELIFLINANHRNYDALFTSVTVIAIALLEGLQVYIYLASAWTKVAMISKYVIRNSWNSSELVAKSIGCITSLKYFRSWEDKLGQYTLIKSFDYKPMNILYYATFSLVDKTKKGRKEDKRVRLSMDLKRTVIETLKNRDGQLGNGVISLHANEVFDELSWSCTTLPTTTHTIIAWHIATTLCEVEDEEKHPMESRTTNCHVARSLSRYCAYLVAFAPELLPDHSFVSESIFDAMVDEAHELLGGLKTMQERKQALLSQDRGDNRLLVVGGRLANNLIGIDHPWRRWKVLCDFWVEMMLYIAPSNDAKAHLETLPRGGEFITHLWALLTHGGILERPTGPAQNV